MPAQPAASSKQATRAASTLAAAETTKPAIPQPKAQETQDTPSPAVARSIIAVQQSLAMRDLTSARRHMRTLRANESRSPEIQQLAADLSRQERARDAAIANARICAANREPSCAIRNARRAIALDTHNPQAQGALRRAVAVQTDANAEYFRQASALPASPAMAFDARWSVATHHASSSTQPSAERTSYTLFGLGVPADAKGRGDAH
jgi:hypothetical protein